MKNAVRSIALQAIMLLTCGLITVNAFLVSKNLAAIEKNADRAAEASNIKSQISGLALDLQQVQTSQRGYLLTGDESYLAPYSEASASLAARLDRLRSQLSGRDRERLARLASLVESITAEDNETIRLRQLGYRHRAFTIVSSNRGLASLDEARSLLEALSAAQGADATQYEAVMRHYLRRAAAQSMLASCIVVVLTLVAFLAFNRYGKRLEQENARKAEELRAARLHLAQLTGMMFQDVRALLGDIQSRANTLLDTYGGFLPRQGREKAEHIEQGAGEMIRALDGLSPHPPSVDSVNVSGTVEMLSA